MRRLRLSREMLYLTTFVLALCSILYELVIAHTISLLAANTVKWYSVTIGIYLLSMGVGALLCGPIFKNRSPWNSLYLVEICLTLTGSISSSVVHFGHILYGYLVFQGAPFIALPAFFLSAFTITAIIGLLSGLELPLLVRIGNERSKSETLTNRILASDYLGSLAGGLAFPLLLIPKYEVMTICLLTAAVNLIAALIIGASSSTKSVSVIVRSSVVGLLAICLGSGFYYSTRIEQYFLRRYYYLDQLGSSFKEVFIPASDLPKVERFSSPYQKIDLVQEVTRDVSELLLDSYSKKRTFEPDFPDGYYLFLNGDFQFKSTLEEIYHEYFAHVPIIVHGRVPEHILVLGGGDGLLIRELLKYRQVKRITHIDLDRKLIEVAKTHPILKRMNHNSLNDPRVTTTFADAFQYIRHSRDKFEAIYIDFPLAVDYNLSKLFSKEFFGFVRARLTPDGYAVLDSPGTGDFYLPDSDSGFVMSPENDWPIYQQTILAAGFKHAIGYVSNLERDNEAAFAKLGAMSMLTPSAALVDALSPGVSQEQIRKVLARVTAMNIISSFVTDLQQGFVMFSDSEKLSFEYRDPGFPLYVLNERRFKLAFDLKFDSPESPQGFVNSIMRPTLPSLPFWHVRMAL